MALLRQVNGESRAKYLASVALAALSISCSGTAGDPAAGDLQESAPPPSIAGAQATDSAGSPAPSLGAPEDALPRPHGPLPQSAPAVAKDLTITTTALRADIRAWLREGRPRTGLRMRAILLRALHQQRIYRLLADRPRLARSVLARLEPKLLPFARATVRASRALAPLVTPVEKAPRMRTYAPDPAGKLRRLYHLAERRYGVPWEVLAAINYVESKFGRLMGPSSASALGPMQFIPATWDAYGNGGDIMDPHDAIMAAARYLAARGAPDDLRSALYAYNNSYDYVDAVLSYVDAIEASVMNFYNYYFWQVFVSTTRGDKQMTGPGA